MLVVSKQKENAQRRERRAEFMSSGCSRARHMQKSNSGLQRTRRRVSGGLGRTMRRAGVVRRH